MTSFVLGRDNFSSISSSSDNQESLELDVEQPSFEEDLEFASAIGRKHDKSGSQQGQHHRPEGRGHYRHDRRRQKSPQPTTSLPSSPAFSRRLLSSNDSKKLSRHYKKDSRFVLDLYTLTFDENETVEDLRTCSKSAALTPVLTDLGQETRCGTMSMQMPVTLYTCNDSISGGPMSLDSNHNFSQPVVLPSLETNLHKILARKIQDSEEVSFRKAKLLTKAYYKLLRGDPQAGMLRGQVLMHSGGDQAAFRHPPKPIGSGKFSWHGLLNTDVDDLLRMVRGLENTVKALGDYLMDLLLERDDLLAKQDDLLEDISELTDNLL